MACCRLVTVPPFPPLPDFSSPRFSLCIALLTLLPAALPYFRDDLFLVAIRSLHFEYGLGPANEVYRRGDTPDHQANRVGVFRLARR
jgi:hypothetical protein